MPQIARQMTRRATWYLALGPDRPAVEVQGVEDLSREDPLTVRIDRGSVPVGRPCACGRTFPTKQGAVEHAKAHAAVARTAYADFGPRASDDEDVVGHLAPDADEALGRGERFTNALTTACRTCGRRTFDGGSLCGECAALVEATHITGAGSSSGDLDAWVDAIADMYVRRQEPGDGESARRSRFFRLGAELLAEASRPERQWSPVRRYRLCQPGQHRGIRLPNGIVECRRCHTRKSA